MHLLRGWFIVIFERRALIGRGAAQTWHVTNQAPGPDIGAVSTESASNLVCDGF